MKLVDSKKSEKECYLYGEGVKHENDLHLPVRLGCKVVQKRFIQSYTTIHSELHVASTIKGR